MKADGAVVIRLNRLRTTAISVEHDRSGNLLCIFLCYALTIGCGVHLTQLQPQTYPQLFKLQRLESTSLIQGHAPDLVRGLMLGAAEGEIGAEA
jgi:hypothetical protein